MDTTKEKEQTDFTNERPKIDALAAALAAFQAEMPTVPKSHTATVKSDKGSYKYTYASLADVSEAAMPLLAKHGLSFTTLPGNGVLTGMLLHSSGQSLTASLPISGNTPQAVGSSLTYMRRYLIGCITGLVTDDDDDGQIAEASARRKPAEQVTETPTDAAGQARNNLLQLLKDRGVDPSEATKFYYEQFQSELRDSKDAEKIAAVSDHFQAAP